MTAKLHARIGTAVIYLDIHFQYKITEFLLCNQKTISGIFNRLSDNISIFHAEFRLTRQLLPSTQALPIKKISPAFVLSRNGKSDDQKEE